MKKFNVAVLPVVAAFLIVIPLHAQNDLDNVRLFQSYFFDTPISTVGYGEGGLAYSSYDKLNILGIGVQGGYPINEKIEVQSELRYLNWSPDKGDGKSGISDLGIYGRYHVSSQNATNISAGAMITLPIGSKDVGASSLDFGIYGAVRHVLNEQTVLVGTLGLMFFEITKTEYDPGTFQLEEKTSHENSLNLGLGTIYQLNEQLNLVGELYFMSEGDYMMLSGGVDYVLSKGRVRGSLGLGLDDGAPDFRLMGGYSMSLSK